MAGSIGVVGAGMAGLAAAWRLAQAGAKVTVYERVERVGGRLRTEAVAGSRADVVVQLLASHFTETLALARAVGAEGLLVRASGRDALWRRGRPHIIAYGSALSMARSSALPLRLKTRLATRYLSFLRRHAAVLDANAPARARVPGADESVAAWGRRELGTDFVELLAYPLLASYYGLTPEETAGGLYHALAHAALDVQVFAVAGGMARLPEAVARALEARGVVWRLGAPVQQVVAAAGAVCVRGPTGEVWHDGVVVALPAPAAAALEGLAPALRAWLGGIGVKPVTTVALALDRPAPGEGWFGLSFPRDEPPGRALAAVCVEERKAPGLVAPGRGLLVAYPAPAVAERVAAAPAGAVVDGVLEALERVFPRLRAQVIRARVNRVPAGSTVFAAGHFAHIARLEAAWLGPRLALAGDYLVAPTVEGAVRSGLAAADRLLAPD